MSQFSKSMVAVVVALVLTVGAMAEPMPVTAVTAKAADGAVTDVQVGEMLTAMGVEFTPGTYTSGMKYYDVKLATKDYDLSVRVGLSPNKRSIWFMTYLGDVPENAPAEKFRALLEAINSKTGKMQFRLTGAKLKADQPMDNFGVTPARLRRELDDFAASLQDTGMLWNTTKWTADVKK